MPTGAESRADALVAEAMLYRSASAAAAATDPQALRQRLMQRINAAVGPGLTEWVCGTAANLVAYRGVPVEDLDHILEEISIGRRLKTLRNPAGAFHAQAEKLAQLHALPFGRAAAGDKEAPA